MNNKRLFALLLSGAGPIGGVTPTVNADECDHKTVFTFSGPVEVPGPVLQAGSYVFKLADSSSDRNIVQVFSKDEDHLYGTFLAIPDERLKPAGKPIITFDERPSDSPEAVKAWFYPGETYGHQFVYPKPRAVALAKANRAAVPSMPAELAENTTKPAAATMTEPHIVAVAQAPLKAQQATEEEVEIADVFLAPASTDTTQLPALAYRGTRPSCRQRCRRREATAVDRWDRLPFITAGAIRLAAAKTGK